MLSLPALSDSYCSSSFRTISNGVCITQTTILNATTNKHPDFQSAKQSYRKTAKVPSGFKQADLDRGFLTTGLWQYSRHPNFAAEQTVWVLLYQWGCFSTYSLANWTFAGAMSYLILFQGSTWLTELLSSGKYPEYKEYQARVGKFLPKLTGEGWGDYTSKQQKEVKRK